MTGQTKTNWIGIVVIVVGSSIGYLILIGAGCAP